MSGNPFIESTAANYDPCVKIRLQNMRDLTCMREWRDGGHCTAILARKGRLLHSLTDHLLYAKIAVQVLMICRSEYRHRL